jgi:hypothetical protein
MRSTCAVLAFVAAIFSVTSASAERRMFIIASNASGYGVDRCLVSGATCGAAIAAAYCRSREFSQAVSYRRVQKDDITGAASNAAGRCRGKNCEEFVAIECMR